jgi:acyl-CoA thioesterase-2
VPTALRTFLGLEATDDPLRWRLPVTPSVSSTRDALFGGCGLAAAIEAMEQVSGRPCVWASAQYLGYAPTGSVVDFEVTLARVGKEITQARAVGRMDGEEILTINAALGRRHEKLAGAWALAPDVIGPDRATRGPLPDVLKGTVFGRVELRLAEGRLFEHLDGSPGSGRVALWGRMPELLEASAGSLAVLGDFVPVGIWQALGRPIIAQSLDNSIRVVRTEATDWVLIDVRVQAVEAGFGHGLAHLWSADGHLLATASQSVVVRPAPPG